MSRKLTTEEFIAKASSVHSYVYDYTETVYQDTRSKITVICPRHGTFHVRASSHMQGEGCRKCGYESRALTTEEFISRSKRTHATNYDYSKVEYINATSKVCIGCPIHGDFDQQAYAHLSGQGCPKCYEESKPLTTMEFITKSKERHGDRYDYSKTVYYNANLKVDIICLTHGIFSQKPYAHIDGQGCPACNLEARSLSTDEFITKAVAIHGELYDYSMVNYIGTKINVDITCPKHGKFSQKPNDHLSGCGCPICNESRGERLIRKILMEVHIEFESQKCFNDLKSPKDALMYYDFFIPSRNILIEFDGRQHVDPIDIFGGDEYLETVKIYDKLKTDYATTNGIELIRFTYKDSSEMILERLKTLLTMV